MARSVEHPTLDVSSGPDQEVVWSRPMWSPTLSMEPVWDPLSLSLCFSPFFLQCMLFFFLSNIKIYIKLLILYELHLKKKSNEGLIPLLQRRQHGLLASAEVEATFLLLPWQRSWSCFWFEWRSVATSQPSGTTVGGLQEAALGMVGGSSVRPPADCRTRLCGCRPHFAGSVTCLLWRFGQNAPNLEGLNSCSQVSRGRPAVSLSIWGLPGVSVHHFFIPFHWA